MKALLLKKCVLIGLFIGFCAAVFSMHREQEEPLEESIRIESIVDAWTNQLRGGRFNLHAADFADLDLALNYLRSRQNITMPEKQLADIINDEIQRRVKINEGKKIAADLVVLGEDLNRYARYPDTIPLDVDFLQSLLSSVVTYQIASNQSEAFSDLKNLLQGMIFSLTDYQVPVPGGDRLGVNQFALVPKDNLGKLGLCPLYPRLIEIGNGNPQLVALPVFYTTVIKTPVLEWQTEEIPVQKTKYLTCSLDLSPDLSLPNLKVELFQLKTIYQDEFAQTVGACPTLAVRNALLLQDFVNTGQETLLKNLHNSNSARDFIMKHGCITWANMKEVESYFLQNFPGRLNKNIGFMPTLLLLNDQYNQITYQPREILGQVAEIKNDIINGLRQDKFFYSLIVGNEEKAIMGKGMGHYYTLGIIKNGNTVQFVVTDTLATRYYLYEDAKEVLASKELNLYEIKKTPSYELRLLTYFIETVLKGSSNRIDIMRDTPLRPNQ
ncbi:hypothetical protein Noda2021_11800 [Candidatus Dependentiae bacterium Noda2021]|nr:hypothetical protein Noda2021_11800 [Candidatus Dependentiae bacterium Noda2021]